MRVEIKKLHERLGSTFIYVTHDQVEALAMADRIAVMDGGKLRQFGTPEEVYRRPANTSVAQFIGSPSMNLMTGRLVESAGKFAFEGPRIPCRLMTRWPPRRGRVTGNLTLGVRPEGLSINSSGLPLLGEGRVYAVEPLGSDQFVDVTYGGGDGAELIKVRARPDARFRVGDAISLNASPADFYLFDGGGYRIFPNDAGPMSAAAKSLARSDARFALSIVAGLILFNTIIFILPLLYAAWISFHDRDVILHTQEFIGFGNYRQILASPEAIAAILLSLKFTVLVAAASLLIGLGIALVLNEEFPGRRLLRAAVLLPWAISEVATATAWMFVVNPTFGALDGRPSPAWARGGQPRLDQ